MAEEVVSPRLLISCESSEATTIFELVAVAAVLTYRKWRPSGRNCGQRCERSCEESTVVTRAG